VWGGDRVQVIYMRDEGQLADPQDNSLTVCIAYGLVSHRL
jgi:hypothetical protein